MSTRRPRSDADRVGHIREAAGKLAVIVAGGREAFDASWVDRHAATGVDGRPARDRARALIQFVEDWNYWLDFRVEMLDGPPAADLIWGRNPWSSGVMGAAG